MGMFSSLLCRIEGVGVGGCVRAWVCACVGMCVRGCGPKSCRLAEHKHKTQGGSQDGSLGSKRSTEIKTE